jgi:hypothetical protein
MRKCYLFCDGGFNNRFNVLLSGLVLSKKTKTHPIIIWNKTNFCSAEFKDIFECDHDVYDFDYNSFFDNHETLNIMHYNPFNKILEERSASSFNSLEEIVSYINSKNKDIFFHLSLRPSWVNDDFLISEILPNVPFRKEIMGEVNKFLRYNNKEYREYYGIHIRKTDFPEYDERLEKNLFDIVKNNKREKFFVCSDDKQTEEKFKSLSNTFTYQKYNYVEKLNKELNWGDEVKDTYGRVFPFNVNRSKMNVVEAVIDMVILSKSKILLTNTRSTFLQNAILLNSYWKRTNQYEFSTIKNNFLIGD